MHVGCTQPYNKIQYDCYFAPESNKNLFYAAAHKNDALTSIVSPLFLVVLEDLVTIIYILS